MHKWQWIIGISEVCVCVCVRACSCQFVRSIQLLFRARKKKKKKKNKAYICLKNKKKNAVFLLYFSQGNMVRYYILTTPIFDIFFFLKKFLVAFWKIARTFICVTRKINFLQKS